MVNNVDVDVVNWNPKGDSFVIEDIDEFSKVRTQVPCSQPARAIDTILLMSQAQPMY